MTIEPQTFVAVAVPAVGVLVWLVRLEGRIDKNESVTSALRADVTYIRDRIDAALNGHHD
jgi:hypothetical protein